MPRWITSCLACVLLPAGVGFAARVSLESYASGFDSIPIAVVEFRPMSNSPVMSKNHPWKIVADDLEFTGKFTVARLAKPDSAVFAERNIGIFVDGEYTVEGQSVVLDCYLHDAATMDLLMGKKYRSALRHVRNMAHRFTNVIVETLLGEQGPFESKILFVMDKGTVKNLAIMDFDGYAPKQLTSTSTVNVFPAFVDTTSVIWTGFNRGKPDIYRGSISTGKTNIFLYSRFIEASPAASPIDGRIAYASSRNGNLDIYVCNSDGTNRRQLTFGKGIDTSPCWSPNGYHIAFTSDRSGRPQIYVMDADGVNTRRVTFEGSYQDSPAWAPRGDRIAHSSLDKGKFDIWVVKPDGTEAKQVTAMPGNNEYPTWSPDGSHIAFVSSRQGKNNIFCIRPDGSDLKQITRSGNAKMPDWSRF